MPVRINRREFRDLVARALDELPEEFARAMENVEVVIEEEPSEEELESLGLDPEQDTLLGLFSPEPGLPTLIKIYRLPILDACETRAQVVQEVVTTIEHEIGHYFGLGESEVPP